MMTKNGRVLLAATITDVGDGSFVYPACEQCYSKLTVFRAQGCQRYQCQNCRHIYNPCQENYRYRLCLTVTDSTTLASVTAFGGMLNSFFGVTASEFHNTYISAVRDKFGVSCEIILQIAAEQAFVGQRLLFGLKTTASGGRKINNKPVGGCSRDTLKDICQNVWSHRSAARHLPEFIAVQMVHQTDSACQTTVVECLQNILSTIEKHHLTPDSCTNKAALLQLVNSSKLNGSKSLSPAGCYVRERAVSPPVGPVCDISLNLSTDQSSLCFSCDSSHNGFSKLDSPNLAMSGHHTCLQASNISALSPNKLLETCDNKDRTMISHSICSEYEKDQSRRKENVTVHENVRKELFLDRNQNNCIELHEEARLENIVKLINSKSKTDRKRITKVSGINDSTAQSNPGDNCNKVTNKLHIHRNVHVWGSLSNTEGLNSQGKENSSQVLHRNTSRQARKSWRKSMNSNHLLPSSGSSPRGSSDEDEEEVDKLKEQKLKECLASDSLYSADSSFTSCQTNLPECSTERFRLPISQKTKKVTDTSLLHVSKVPIGPHLKLSHSDPRAITSPGCKQRLWDFDNSLNRQVDFSHNISVVSKVSIANKSLNLISKTNPLKQLDDMVFSNKESKEALSAADTDHRTGSSYFCANTPPDNDLLNCDNHSVVEDGELLKESTDGIMEVYPDSEGLDLFLSKANNSFVKDNENTHNQSCRLQNFTNSISNQAHCFEIGRIFKSQRPKAVPELGNIFKDQRQNAVSELGHIFSNPRQKAKCDYELSDSCQVSCASGGETCVNTGHAVEKIIPLSAALFRGSDTPQKQIVSQNVKNQPTVINPQKPVQFHIVKTPQKLVEIHIVKTPQKPVEIHNVKTPQKRVEFHNVKTAQKRVEFHNVKTPQKPVEIHSVKTPQTQVEFHNVKTQQKRVEFHNVKTPQKRVEFHNVKTAQKRVEFHNVKTPQKPVEIHSVKTPQTQVEFHNVKTQQKRVEFHNVKTPQKPVEIHSVKTPQKRTEFHNVKIPQKQTEFHNVKNPQKPVRSQNLKNPQKKSLSENRINAITLARSGRNNTLLQALSQNVNTPMKQALSQNIKNAMKCMSLGVENTKREPCAQIINTSKKNNLPEKVHNTNKQTLLHNSNHQTKKYLSHTYENSVKQILSQNVSKSRKQTLLCNAKDHQKQTSLHNIKKPEKQPLIPNVKEPGRQTLYQSVEGSRKQTLLQQAKEQSKQTLPQNITVLARQPQNMKHLDRQLQNIKDLDRQTSLQNVNELDKQTLIKHAKGLHRQTSLQNVNELDKQTLIKHAKGLHRQTSLQNVNELDKQTLIKHAKGLHQQTSLQNVNIPNKTSIALPVSKVRISYDRNSNVMFNHFPISANMTLRRSKRKHSETTDYSHNEDTRSEKLYCRDMATEKLCNIGRGTLRTISADVTSTTMGDSSAISDLGDHWTDSDLICVYSLSSVNSVSRTKSFVDESVTSSCQTVQEVTSDKVSSLLGHRPRTRSFTRPTVSKQGELKDISFIDSTNCCMTTDKLVGTANGSTSHLQNDFSQEVFSDCLSSPYFSAVELGGSRNNVDQGKYGDSLAGHNGASSKLNGYRVDILEQNDRVSEILKQNGRATEIIDQDGRATEITDQDGRATEITDQDGRATEITDQDGRATEITKQLNSRTSPFPGDLKSSKGLSETQFPVENVDLCTKDRGNRGQYSAHIQRSEANRSFLESEGQDLWCYPPTPQRHMFTKRQIGESLVFAMSQRELSNSCPHMLQKEKVLSDVLRSRERPEVNGGTSKNSFLDSSRDLFSSQDEIVVEDDVFINSNTRQNKCGAIGQRSHSSNNMASDLSRAIIEKDLDNPLRGGCVKKRVRFATRKQKHYYFDFEIIGHLPVVNQVTGLKSSLKRASMDWDLFESPDLFSGSSQCLTSVDLEMEPDVRSARSELNLSPDLFSQSPQQPIMMDVPRHDVLQQSSMTSTPKYSNTGQTSVTAHSPQTTSCDTIRTLGPEKLQYDWSIELFTPPPPFKGTTRTRHVSDLSPAVRDHSLNACLTPDLFS